MKDYQEAWRPAGKQQLINVGTNMMQRKASGSGCAEPAHEGQENIKIMHKVH